MTDPKKTEDTKKPASTTDQPKKDEGTVKAAEATTTKAAEPAKDPEAPKTAEQAKADAKPVSDGGANIQTKHENIQTGPKDPTGAPTSDPTAPQEIKPLEKLPDLDPEDDPDYTPPETIDDEALRETIGDVAFASDTNAGGKHPTEAQRNPQDPVVPVKGSLAASQPSIDRLKSIVYAYPKDASNGTVVFGYGGISITIGDLRAVVAVL